MAQFPDEQGSDGSFERQEDAFRQMITDPTPGRYHLYICKACPWAHRSWIVLRLMGLEDVIDVSFADPIRTDEEGWAFREGRGHGPDQAVGFAHLKEAYIRTDPDFTGRVTVPVLWDKEQKKIINNSEDDICRMFCEVFKPLATPPVDLFPADLSVEQNTLSNFIYETINNGSTKRVLPPVSPPMTKRSAFYSTPLIRWKSACRRTAPISSVPGSSNRIGVSSAPWSDLMPYITAILNVTSIGLSITPTCKSISNGSTISRVLPKRSILTTSSATIT
jgi:hypothetical protein